MPLVYLQDLRLKAECAGPMAAPPLVFLNAHGTDLSMWDEVVAQLTPQFRCLRFDMRGQGQSDVPPAPYAMGALIRDAERLVDHFGLRETVVIGAGLGGLVAQGLAIKRLDLVRAMVLSNTAARIGSPSQWQTQIAAVRAQGLAAQSQGLAAQSRGLLERWLGPRLRSSAVLPRLQALLDGCPTEGWIGGATAMSGTDFYTPTASLTLPTLVIASANDGITPADLVRETADLILGHRFALMRGVGHLPMVENPAGYTALLSQFLQEIGHG